MQNELTARYEFGLKLVQEAGAVALGYFRNLGALTVKNKGPQDVVSEADLNTEILIKNALEKHFPEDAFLGEETGITAYAPDQGIWVVDPIDGTQPFVSGLSSWCVSIAFVKGGELQFGMVFAPERNELFAGGIGFPATVNGQPVPAHKGRSLKQGMTGTGYSPRLSIDEYLPMFTLLLRKGGTFFREGSGALSLCYVASGRLLGYVEPHINSWDCLGAMAVIHAAGLKTNDFLKDNGLTKGNYLIAGNAEVYAELDEIYTQTYGK